MMFSSIHHSHHSHHSHHAHHAAMARPLPRPHVQCRADDADARHLHGTFTARTFNHGVESKPFDEGYGPPTAAPNPPRITTLSTITTTKKKPKKSLSPAHSSTSANTSSDSGSLVNLPTKNGKKLSTERSRLCRQRQKGHADMLEKTVTALRNEVATLVTLRDLRREQLVYTPSAQYGSLARIVHEYCAVFEYGMAPESMASMGGVTPFALASRKRTLATSQQLTAQEQCDFLLSIMDPEVQVFDWIGRTKRGPEPLVHGWKAWSAWHASIMFHLEGVDVIESDNDTIAVSSRGKICVKVSQKTIEQLFPHVAADKAICARLLGSEIRYPFRDTFYFNETGRVVMYTVDMDCITALHNVVGDFSQVASLVSPPNDVSFNDRAVCTYDGCPLDAMRESHMPSSSSSPSSSPPQRDQRLDLQFLLS